MQQEDRFSLASWAARIADDLPNGETLSKQALAKRLQLGREAFGQALLEKVMLHCRGHQDQAAKSVLFKGFNKVLLEDSMCMGLPDNVSPFIPGPHSNDGTAKSTARIQLSMDIQGGAYQRIAVNSFRDNDQSYAYSSLNNVLQAGDLLIRDLGYHVLGAFAEMNQKGIFFLSRYKYGIHLRLAEQDPEPMKLLAYIQQRKTRSKIDLDVFLGDDRIPCRLVIVKLPAKVAQRKRHKAKKNRNLRANHSPEYYELLGWNLYITNVNRATWTTNQVCKAYRLRWRIEIIFRCWKSKLKIEQFFEKKQRFNPGGVILILYLALCWITLFFNKAYLFFFEQAAKSKNVWISIEKFADYALSRASQLIYEDDLAPYVNKVAYYCKYETKKEDGFFDLLYDEFLS